MAVAVRLLASFAVKLVGTFLRHLLVAAVVGTGRVRQDAVAPNECDEGPRAEIARLDDTTMRYEHPRRGQGVNRCQPAPQNNNPAPRTWGPSPPPPRAASQDWTYPIAATQVFVFNGDQLLELVRATSTASAGAPRAAAAAFREGRERAVLTGLVVPCTQQVGFADVWVDLDRAAIQRRQRAPWAHTAHRGSCNRRHNLGVSKNSGLQVRATPQRTRHERAPLKSETRTALRPMIELAGALKASADAFHNVTMMDAPVASAITMLRLTPCLLALALVYGTTSSTCCTTPRTSTAWLPRPHTNGRLAPHAYEPADSDIGPLAPPPALPSGPSTQPPSSLGLTHQWSHPAGIAQFGQSAQC